MIVQLSLYKQIMAAASQTGKNKASGSSPARSIQRDWDIKVQTGTDISFNLFFFSLVCFCKAYSELSFELFLCVCVCVLEFFIILTK